MRWELCRVGSRRPPGWDRAHHESFFPCVWCAAAADTCRRRCCLPVCCAGTPRLGTVQPLSPEHPGAVSVTVARVRCWLTVSRCVGRGQSQPLAAQARTSFVLASAMSCPGLSNSLLPLTGWQR